jgi:uncharacterized membrane protein YfcA
MAPLWLVVGIILIVGFVTTFLKISIDRFFLVLLFVLWMGFSIQQAIVINALVMLLASLIFFRGAKKQLSKVPSKVGWMIVFLSLCGGFIGRWIALHASNRALFIVLGSYAVLVGLRLLLIKPKLQPKGEIRGRVTIVTLIFSILTGIISAGGKPLQGPILIKTSKLAMDQAYIISTLGTITSIIGFLIGELWFKHRIPFGDLSWSWIFFFGISVVTFVFEPLWNPKAQKWVSLLVGVLLIIVGVRLSL